MCTTACTTSQIVTQMSNHAQTQMCNAHIMHKVGNPIDCCFLRPEMGKWRLFSKNILHRNESGIINGPCKHQPESLKYRICLIHVDMNENTNTNVDTNTNTWGGVVWWHCAGATVSPHCLPWAPPPPPPPGSFVFFIMYIMIRFLMVASVFEKPHTSLPGPGWAPPPRFISCRQRRNANSARS